MPARWALGIRGGPAVLWGDLMTIVGIDGRFPEYPGVRASDQFWPIARIHWSFTSHLSARHAPRQLSLHCVLDLIFILRPALAAHHGVGKFINELVVPFHPLSGDSKTSRRFDLLLPTR